jgi:type III secretory pathway component EscU
MLIAISALGRERNMAFRRGGFELTPPSFVVFIISAILALLAVLVRYAHVSIPVIGSAHVFDVMTVAYVVLLVGVLFKGI